jgi:hypothetical protein
VKHLERKEVLNLVYTQQSDRMADAYARLMADFSQMTAWGRGLESDLSRARVELMLAKAEVERLTKAGDAMGKELNRYYDELGAWGDDPLTKAWNAAKEGKQP